MKYSFELKKEIYKKRCEGYGTAFLSKEYGLNEYEIKYLCRLVDKHGLKAIKHKYTNYSPECKLAAIHRVLVNGEAINSVAIDIGLSVMQKGHFQL